jgi:hypothetical protein
LSPSLLALLDQRVNSFEKLELVMALHREPTRRSTVRQLSDALDLDRDEVRGLAAELMDACLVVFTPPNDLLLEPTTPADRALLEVLARTYDTDKIALAKAIAESSMNRLRGLAGRAFAEAFVIRRKPGGDDDDR